MSLEEKIKQQGFDSDSDDDDAKFNQQRPCSETWTEYLSPSKLCSTISHGFGVIWRQLGVFLQLNFKDISSRKVNYCLGLMSCFVVVIVTALMLTVLVRLPVLFLKLGELSEGQLDFRVTTGGDASRARSLNYSKVLNASLFRTEKYRYHAPRMIFDASDQIRASAMDACNFTGGLDDVWNSTLASISVGSTVINCETAPCISSFCPSSSRGFAANNWLWIDSKRERSAQMGSPNFPSFGSSDGTIPAGACIIDRDAANQLNVSVNDTIVLSGSVVRRLLEAFIQAGLIESTRFPYTPWAQMAVPMKVLGIIDDVFGKVSTDATPVIFTEFSTTLAYMAGFLSPSLSATAKQRVARTNPDEFASAIYWNYPPATRFDKYTHSDYALVLADATAFAGPIVTSLGFNQVDVTVPIVEFMNGTRFFALFLGLIVSIIIVGLGALSVVLVYSLLIVGIQTRQFELGVMRMVGFTRTQLMLYIVTGASLFALPALVLGLVAAQAAFLGVRQAMTQALEVELPAPLEPDAVGFAIFAGLAIPLLASISPILEVLAMSLPDALNTQRGRVQAVLYDIKTDAHRPVNWTLVIFGTALVIFGFLIYYLFPLALFTFNLTLLFYIFFALLLGMLFGCILLAMNFDHFAQTFVAYAFFFLEREAVFKLMRSNLVAHRQRNRSNSLMFATAVGFIVFITVAFDIQIQSVKYNDARRNGGELSIEPRGSARNGEHITFSQAFQLDALFRQERDTGRFPDLQWAWVSVSSLYLPGIPNATYETLGRYKTFARTDMTSASPNFFEVADPSFLIVRDEYKGSAKLDDRMTFSEYLYTREGSGRAIISTYLQQEFAVTGFDGPNDMFQFVITRPGSDGNDEDLRSVTLPAAILDAAPILEFSKFPRRTGQPSVISHPSMMMRANGSITSVTDLRLYQLVVKCKRDEASKLADRISATGVDMRGIEAELLAKREKNLDLASTIVGFFFVFTQGISMAVCFFALISTMSTNIYEHCKEIGILRAIGAPSGYVVRVFVEEAFVLVFAACLMGTLVGTAVAYTMLIQRALFTQLPLPFTFPYFNVVLMFILSGIFALGSTVAPIEAVLGAPSITHILRRSI